MEEKESKNKKSYSGKEVWLALLIAIIIIVIVSILLRLLGNFLQKKIGMNYAYAATAETQQVAKPPYKALRVEQNPIEPLKLKAGEEAIFIVKFKNVGAKKWLGKNTSAPVSLKILKAEESDFYAKEWLSKSEAYRVKYYVDPNVVGTFKFKVKAPDTNGPYSNKFSLFAGKDQIPGGTIEIMMNVYGGKNPPPPPQPIVSEPVNNSPTPYFWQAISPDQTIPEDLRLVEPILRVALFFTDTEDQQKYLPIKIQTLGNAPYEIRDKNNNLLVNATSGDLLEINFNFNLKRYFINSNGQRLLMTDQLLRFSPKDENTIFKVVSWNNGPFWGMPVNDNEFRGIMEVQYNPNTERCWLINELPMEKYLKGVSEVSDSSPYELLKAQKVAARTYAMFRYLNPKYTDTPDEEPIFTLKATQADQVYRGYNFEKRAPNIGRAAEETYGQVILYNNNPIVAYYFAQSDGRTRNSYDVRMTTAPVPYLTAKDDPPGIGKKLLGHGVGMPQRSAIIAAQQGANYLQILKYYYTGVDIKRVYP